MRKYQKAAVVMAVLGSVSFFGAGVSQADNGYGSKGYGSGHGFNIDTKQANVCPAISSENKSADGVLNILNNAEVNLAVLGKASSGDTNVADCENTAKFGN